MRTSKDILLQVEDVEMMSPKLSLRDEMGTSKFEEQKNNQEKFENVDMSFSKVSEAPTIKYPYLESVKARFEQQRKENEERVKVMRTKREVEMAHSLYLKKNKVDPDKMTDAKFVVDAWVNKHVGKAIKRLSRDKKKSSQRTSNRPNILLSPSFKNRIPPAVSTTEGKNNTIHIRNTIVTTQEGNNEAVSRSNVGSNDSVIILSDDDNSMTGSSLVDDVSGPSTSSCAKSYYGPFRPGAAPDHVTSTDVVMKDSKDEIEHHKTCSVIGCNAVFSSHVAKNRHDVNFSHSPCNPLLLNINCELTLHDKYMCPKCCKIFKSNHGCKEHMKTLQHLPFLSPLVLGGYICAQCLNIFGNHQDCCNHIKDMKHRDVAYPFKDDFAKDTPLTPVPVSLQFIKEFCGVCEAVTFNLKCVDCGIGINSPLHLSQHQIETHNTHCISATATSTQVEAFSTFLSSHFCSLCTCICEKTDENGFLKHKCSKNHTGDIVDLNCKSFSEFVTMCGIRCHRNSITTVISSEDDEEEESLTCSQILKKNKRKKIKNKTAELKVNDQEILFSGQSIQTMSGCQETLFVSEKSENIPEAEQLSKTDPANLIQMKNILLLDLDNWPKFFQKLTDCLPDKTFVWGFYGGNTVWKEPVRCPPFDYQKKNGRFHLHDRCGQSKDAADFAICITVGKLDASLPKDISFTILSGDKGFHEVEHQLKNSERKAVIIDPHDAQKISPDMIFSMIASVSEK